MVTFHIFGWVKYESPVHQEFIGPGGFSGNILEGKNNNQRQSLDFLYHFLTIIFTYNKEINIYKDKINQ